MKKMMTRFLAALCVLCSLAAASPARAALHFDNPVTWANGQPANLAADPLVAGGLIARYGSGAFDRNPVGHVGGQPEIDQQALNRAIAAGALPDSAKAILAAAGTDGGPLSYVDWLDLHFLRFGSSTYAKALLDAIQAANGPAPEIVQPSKLQYDEVKSILLSAGDPRGLVDNIVTRVADDLGKKYDAAEARAVLRAQVGPALPTRWAVPEEVIALHDAYEAAFGAAIGADPQTQQQIRVEQAHRLRQILELVQPPPLAPNASSLVIDASYAVAILRGSLAWLKAEDQPPAKALDGALHLSIRQADALQDPTGAWAGYALDSNPVIR